jgi:1-phosphatidylinositol phosphodiesterase
MPSLITVRNLTSSSVSIRRIEEFEDPSTLQSKSSGSFLSAKNTTSSAPSATELGEHAGRFRQQDLEIVLEPFEGLSR